MQHNKKFNKFISEDLDSPRYHIGVHKLEDALTVSRLLKDNGYNYIEDFDDDLVEVYFETYRIGEDDDRGIFAFKVFPNEKAITFRVYTNSLFNHFSEEAAGIYPRDLNLIRRKINTRPTYAPKQFIKEGRNEIQQAKEIAIKINNQDEYNKLEKFVEDFDDEYYNTFSTTEINNDYYPYYFYFCVDKNDREGVPGLVSSHNTGYNARDIERLLDDIENTGQFDGVYKDILSMEEDFDYFKDIMNGKRIIPRPPKRPVYRPRKFVRENVSSFKDFMIDSILEKDTEVPFIISSRLEGLLSKIKHPIAERMIKESKSSSVMTTKATMIDYDDEFKDKFTYTLPNKFVDAAEDLLKVKYSDMDQSTLYDVMKLNKQIYEVFRTSIKIGRLVNKIYPSEYKPTGDDSIESFVNAIKLERNRKFDKFEIVSGNTIMKYYNENSYSEEAFGGSELGNSCMRYDECTDFIYFYSINPDVSLLILKSTEEGEEDLIVARALVWNIAECNGSGVTDKFMDRVYFTHNYQMELFKEYAKDNKWFYKKRQNDASIIMWNPYKNDFEECLLRTKSTFKQNPTDEYPYMDTMKWFYVDRGFLANTLKFKEEHEDVYFMEETGGGYHVERSGKYVDYYDDYFDEDELIWCEYGDDYRLKDDAIWLEHEGQYATDEFARFNCALTYDGKWVLNDDAVMFVDNRGREDMAFREDAEKDFYFSDYDDTWYQEAVKSEYHNTFIGKPRAVKVYFTDDMDKIIKGDAKYDYLLGEDDKDKYFDYTYDNKVYFLSSDLKDKFVPVRTSIMSPENKFYYHKINDKDEFKKVGDEYYTTLIADIVERKKGK